MKCVVLVAVMLGTALAASVKPKDTGKLAPFLDCPKKTFNVFSMLLPWKSPTITNERICCESALLPKGCECFDISERSGWTNSKGHLPQCPEFLGVEFYLYTKANKEDFFMLSSLDYSLAHSHFDAAKPTKFIVHGFTDWAPSPWTVAMKDHILGLDDVNVILVNWHDGSIGFNYNYWRATANVRPTAAVVANFITFLINDHDVKPKDIHLIGHSMGGQVVGGIGKEVQRLTQTKLGRISGMDAAGHGFEDFDVHVHLDKSDADFVDLIHTDTVDPGLGVRNAHGHVDFFMNGASVQPGCAPNPVTFEEMLNFAEGTLDSVCSHTRAFEFYSSSVSTCKITSDDDDKCVVGYLATPGGCTGSHNVTTKATDAPYCP